MFSAHWTLRIAAQSKFTEFHFQRIEMQQASEQWLALADDQLQSFRGLHQSDDSWQYAEHACFGATGRSSRGRRLRKQTAVAGSAQMRREDAGLAFKTENGAVDVRFAGKYADIIRKVTSWKIVGPIDDDIIGCN